MGIFDAIKHELRSVIEWERPEKDILFYCWSDNGDEIKNASKLIVGPGQGCIFVYEGKVVSVLEDEGMVSLLTDNIPFWTTISRVMQSFESEHKTGFYFYNKTMILDQKWGTRSTIKYDDSKYKFPVALRAFGNYSFQIEDATSFFVNVLGTQEYYSSDDFREMMSSRILQPIADFLATSQFSYAEIDANREEVSAALGAKLSHDFDDLGFVLSDFRIEGIEFDDETLGRINKIADISASKYGADVAGVSYTQLERLEAMKDAANNESGAAGVMMGMGVGGGLAQETLVQEAQGATSVKARLQILKELFESDLISDDEYQVKKKQILDEL